MEMIRPTPLNVRFYLFWSIRFTSNFILGVIQVHMLYPCAFTPGIRLEWISLILDSPDVLGWISWLWDSGRRWIPLWNHWCLLFLSGHRKWVGEGIIYICSATTYMQNACEQSGDSNHFTTFPSIPPMSIIWFHQRPNSRSWATDIRQATRLSWRTIFMIGQFPWSISTSVSIGSIFLGWKHPLNEFDFDYINIGPLGNKKQVQPTIYIQIQIHIPSYLPFLLPVSPHQNSTDSC